jgi:hypothetical protein
MIRRTAAAVGLAVALGLWPASVAAHDHRPPHANVITETDRQRASRGGYEWAEKQGRFCSIVIADVVAVGAPEAVRTPVGERIRFRFKKDERPKAVTIRQYRDVNRHGEPKGDGRWMFFTLGRVVVNGNVRWEARFDLNRPGHHYLRVDARWRDVDGCGPQEVEWMAHLRATRG